MSDPVQDPQSNGPFLRVAFVLLAIGLCAAVMALPYIARLEAKALAIKSASLHLDVPILLALSVLQSMILLAVAVFAGLWAARKLGLGTPLLAGLVYRRPLPESMASTFFIAIIVGAVMGLVMLALDRWVFVSLSSVGEFIGNVRDTNSKPEAWQGFLASFYGAFDEEILMRLGLLSLVALAFRTLSRLLGARHDLALPVGVFWAANIVVAVVFGLGHLPATAAIAPLTTALVVRAIALNGIAGLAFGVLYKRYGLEWGMAGHFATDIVLHVMA